IYEAADRCRDRCVVRGTSFLWPGSRAWTPQNIKSLWEAFIGNPDAGEGTFLTKWREQLAILPVDVHRIAADVVAFYYLFPAESQVGKKLKLQRLQTVIDWKLSSECSDLDLVKRAFEAEGIGSGGQYYLMHVPWQIA